MKGRGQAEIKREEVVVAGNGLASCWRFDVFEGKLDEVVDLAHLAKGEKR